MRRLLACCNAFYNIQSIPFPRRDELAQLSVVPSYDSPSGKLSGLTHLR